MTDALSGDARRLVEDLFPGPVDDGSPSAVLIAIPTWSRCRWVLPADGRPASSSVRRLVRGRGVRRSAVRVLAAAVLATGVGRWWPHRMRVRREGPSIEHQLSETLGRPVRVAVFLGPPRANRKPVLQVMDTRGRLIAYAKVATGELTTRIAETEARALGRIPHDRLVTVRAARLLATTWWGDRLVTVQSALPVPARSREVPPALLDDAVREIAAVEEPVRRTPFASSPLAASSLGAADRLSPDSAHRVRALVAQIVDRDPELELGSWHGDFSAWNMALGTDGRLLVWDWERFEGGVPVGFDLLHHRFMTLLKDPGREVANAAVDLLADLPVRQALAGLQGGADAVDDVIWLYLVNVAARFSGDRQDRTGVRGGDVDAWLTPALRTLEKGAGNG